MTTEQELTIAKVYPNSPNEKKMLYVLDTVFNGTNELVIEKDHSRYYSLFFYNENTFKKTLGNLELFGLIKKENRSYSLTRLGRLAREALRKKGKYEAYEVINLAAYEINLVYRELIQLLYDLAIRKVSGSSVNYYTMPLSQQYEYVNTFLKNGIGISVDKPRIIGFSHFLRKLNMFERNSLGAQLRDSVWAPMILLSIQCSLDIEKKQTRIDDVFLKSVCTPLFLTEKGFMTFLQSLPTLKYYTVSGGKSGMMFIEQKAGFDMFNDIIGWDTM